MAPNRDHLLLLLVFIISVLGASYYTGLKYLFYADAPLPNLSLNYVFSGLFVWQQNFYSGYLNSTSATLSIFLLALFDAINIIAGLRIAIFITVSLFVFIGAAGAYYLVSEILNKHNHKMAGYAGLLASVFMSFSWLAYTAPISITGIAIVPFLLLFLYKSMKYINTNGTISKKYLVTSILLLSLQIAIGGILLTIPILLLILLVIVFVALLTATRKNLSKYLYYGLIVISLAILINAPYLITTKMTTDAYNEVYLHQVNVNNGYNLARNVTSLFSFGDLIESSNNVINSFKNIFTLVLFLIIFYGVYSIFEVGKRNKKFDYTRKVVLAIYGSFLSIMFLYLLSNGNGYLGPLYDLISKYIPPQLNYMYLFGILPVSFFALILAILLPISIIFSIGFHRRRVLCAIFVILAILYIYIYAYIPISNGYVSFLGNGATVPNGVQIIPKYVFAVSDYINKNISNQYSVLTLPQTYYWGLTTWYNGSNVYGSLIDAPVYTGYFGFTSYGEYFFPPSMNMAYLESKSIDTLNLIGTSPSKLYGILGIKYIIVQGDATSESNFVDVPANKFNFSTIYTNLNESAGLAFAKEYNTTRIYINNEVVPLVYGANLIRLGNLSTQELVNYITQNKSFDISNEALSTDYIQGFGVSGGPMFGSNVYFNLTTPSIQVYQNPNVTSIESDPTKIIVHITNATTPFYLVFRETYDPHWVASYSNASMISSEDHIAVNGFANAWYINRTGSYTITLYYTLQTYAWYAWMLAFTCLLATCYIGWLAYKKSKESENKENRHKYGKN